MERGERAVVKLKERETLLTEVAVLREQIDFGQHVDVRELEVQHRPQRQKQHRDVLCRVGHVVRVAEVHCGQLYPTHPSIHPSTREKEVKGEAYPKPALPQLVNYPLQAGVVRAQLDLPR